MRRVAALVVCVVLFAAVCALSLILGAREVPLEQVVAAIVSPIDSNADHIAVRDLRMPRTVIGIVAGVALALAGVLMQAISRNPLADPGLLGVNAGASLLVVVAITWFGVTSAAGFVWFAVAGAALAAAVTYAIASGRSGLASPVTITLAGSAVTAIITSLTTLVLISNLQTLNQYRFWAVGSLSGRQLDVVGVVLPLVVVGVGIAVVVGRTLNVLALGADVATGLGQRVGVTRAVGAVGVVLLCAGATAIAGPIAFVGLVVPHIARRWAGADLRWIVFFSIVIGPTLLVAADILGRLIVPPGELEAGIVVAFVGAPVLVLLVRRSKLAML